MEIDIRQARLFVLRKVLCYYYWLTLTCCWYLKCSSPWLWWLLLRWLLMKSDTFWYDSSHLAWASCSTWISSEEAITPLYVYSLWIFIPHRRDGHYDRRWIIAATRRDEEHATSLHGVCMIRRREMRFSIIHDGSGRKEYPFYYFPLFLIFNVSWNFSLINYAMLSSCTFRLVLRWLPHVTDRKIVPLPVYKSYI